MSADRNRNGGKDFSRSLPNRRFFPFPFKLQRYNSLVKSSLRRRPEDRVLATLQTRSRETIDTRMQLLDVRGPWGSKPPPPPARHSLSLHRTLSHCKGGKLLAVYLHPSLMHCMSSFGKIHLLHLQFPGSANIYIPPNMSPLQYAR